MTLSNRIWLLLICAPLIFLQGCFDYEDIDFKGVQNISLVEKTEKDLKIKVTVLINNPNKFNIKVKKSTLDLYVNGQLVDKAILEEKVVLKKETEAAYDVFVSANARNIIKAAMGSLGGMLKGNVTIGLKGKVKGSVYGITKSVPVDMEEKVNLKDFL